MSALRRLTRALPCILAAIPPSAAIGQLAVAKPALDSAVFVTRLGSDTLVIERVVRSPRRVEAEVVFKASGASETSQPLLSGNRVAMFKLARLGSDSMTITHRATAMDGG